MGWEVVQGGMCSFPMMWCGLGCERSVRGDASLGCIPSLGFLGCKVLLMDTLSIKGDVKNDYFWLHMICFVA